MTAFADFQNEVYLKGLFGEQPTMAFGWRELQAAAEQVMTPGAVGYVSGGAGGEETMRANREAFDRWRLVPRMLRGIPAERDLSTTVLGTTMPAPVMLAPVGVLSIVHADAERAVARACHTVPPIPPTSASANTTTNATESQVSVLPAPKAAQARRQRGRPSPMPTLRPLPASACGCRAARPQRRSRGQWPARPKQRVRTEPA